MSSQTLGCAFHLLGRLVVGLASIVLVIATALPLLRNNDWWIRIFDFPRLQFAVLLAVTLLGYAGLRFLGALRPWELVLAGLAGMSLAWQLYLIAPYTRFYPHQMAQSFAQDNSNRISLLIFNVLHDNTEVEALRELIRETDPDIILLSEPTQWWLEQLDGLQEEYPHTLFQPQENHYGKLLYSKLELINPEIRFLIDPEIPSIRTQLRLRSGTRVTLYGVHPRPPGLRRPNEEDNSQPRDDTGEESDDGEREDTDMRDAELLQIAKEINAKGNIPVIVAGDFNDVAWSHTTHLFQRVGGLLDPRVGRGLLNTFDTRNRLLRYPLDHVFASEHFLLVELRRLPHIGSDHFPMLVVLDYDPDASAKQEAPQADADDEAEAEKAIDEGKSD